MTWGLRSFASFKASAVLLALFLAGCGGGGGGGGMPPAPANRPPAFTSTATASAAENGSGTIYTATAADPDGNALIFSWSGGVDRAGFAITAGGALSFVQAPDFEVPTDADGNNVYLVQIGVSDGATSAILDLAVTVTNVGPDAFRVTRVGTGFDEPRSSRGTGCAGHRPRFPAGRRPARKEIDLMRPNDGGANFGWRVLEGTAQFTGPAQPGFVPPVAEYLHGSGPREGRAVTGGYVYRGPVEALRGQYIFADLGGRMWSIPIVQIALGTTLPSSRFIIRTADFAPSQGTITFLASFGLDQSGNLYIVDLDGEIFRIEAG